MIWLESSITKDLKIWSSILTNDSISGDPRMEGKEGKAHKNLSLYDEQTDQNPLDNPWLFTGWF